MASYRYEYDPDVKVLIRVGPTLWIISQWDPVWRRLTGGGVYDSYHRAIMRGQGCWERLDTISEEQAFAILAQWGCAPYEGPAYP